MSHILGYLLSNPFDSIHLIAYVWLLFILAQIVLSFVSNPKGIVERLIILFQKQHLFLLFSAIIISGYILAPLIRVQSGSNMQYVFSDSRMLSPNVNFPIIGHYFVFVCIVAALITLALNLLTICLNKFRPFQIVLCWLSIIPAIFCFCFVYYTMTTTDLIADQLFYYGNISPIAAVIFIFLAMWGIRQDEDLVKSIDRLR